MDLFISISMELIVADEDAGLAVHAFIILQKNGFRHALALVIFTAGGKPAVGR